ncbi:hypothetical protein VOLCADRAFT_101059 [Volvox carteri f. nagariensis]|uniref:peptidylprolyl isomerase n=1 Tax=Volvox carteri f. nagariensis TaxID=3068 RepID=D8ULN1_VOLCA|nr:uncharacterized protein VOLCADRAFT_101059 [Volvox carteri f. nagariensis]EFJ39367.1 hypothetical protein VOLCADRAFT_101059 [Volvox carteri f. nagariensis]|eukprot:XP_002959568.1 hypothetical protein VOLCADRAFT_101059 [Volvox carteri f. nagariensis]
MEQNYVLPNWRRIAARGLYYVKIGNAKPNTRAHATAGPYRQSKQVQINYTYLLYQLVEIDQASNQVSAALPLVRLVPQGFDEAVRGMAVGQTTVLEASGGEWRRELLFAVPRDHPEVQRLEGRYKNQGGIAPGLVVELANGAMAVILEVNDAEVKLDANNMLAGKTFTIELELLSIDTPASSDG